MSVMAMILAGGEGPALSVLTAFRSEAAVPFGGKYRIIDFSLSNCVNSGIFDVAVLTQYRPRSLNEHIGVGRPWDLDRASGGVRLLQPYQSTRGERGAWQEGTADALRFNLDVARYADEVLLLSGDHIYKMDYQPLLRFHRERGADVTIAARSVPNFDAYRFGMMTTDPDGHVTDYEEKPRRTSSNMANMGVYVFRRDALLDCLVAGACKKARDVGRDVIPEMTRAAKVYAYPFHGYWADAGTIQAYYEANMALLAETPALDLYDPEWPIYTPSQERPAVLLGAEARAQGNLLCDGCRVDGTVIRSIIFPGVYVAAGAIVRDSIIMSDTVIEVGAEVDRAIVDKRVKVDAGAKLGWGGDNAPNQKWPGRLNTGITVVGKDAMIPAGYTVGRNVVIAPKVTTAAYTSAEIASGSTIGG